MNYDELIKTAIENDSFSHNEYKVLITCQITLFPSYIYLKLQKMQNKNNNYAQ